MELICPSCEARYQIPEGAIGPKGRQVSCMSCGHAWHAEPPLVLGNPKPAALRPAPSASSAPPRATAFAEGMDEMDGRDDRVMPSASRSEQLAEIRQILAEVQSESAGAADVPVSEGQDRRPDARLVTAGAPEEPSPSPALETMGYDAMPGDDQPSDTGESDPLRERLAAQARKDNAKPRPPNTDKYKKNHARREGRHRRARAAGSGAFMTGFLLIVIIVAVMVAMYLLKPEIVAQVPGTERAMNEYTDTIDSIRDSVGSRLGALVNWFSERINRLL